VTVGTTRKWARIIHPLRSQRIGGSSPCGGLVGEAVCVLDRHLAPMKPNPGSIDTLVRRLGMDFPRVLPLTPDEQTEGCARAYWSTSAASQFAASSERPRTPSLP